jgi:uncharacterized protein
LKLHLDAANGLNSFTGYGAGYVMVNGERHERTIVLPDRVITDWPATTFDTLTADHMEALLPLVPEVLLLGTGTTLRFPRAEILAPLIRAQVGYEVMDVQAACRTYNILMAEERRVAAVLLLG